MSWTHISQEIVLRQKGSMIFKHGGKQLVIFAVEDQYYAIDNRCPHEGYPLKEGSIDTKTCVLTCQWHNWKFDLKTGATLIGEDAVRTYPLRVVDGKLEVDLTDPDPESKRAVIMSGLMVAVEKGQYGRIAREISRLESSGLSGIPALKEVLHQVADKVEYGMTHAWAASADWLTIYDAAAEDLEQKVIALTEAIYHLSDDTLRHPHYPYATELVPFEGEAFLSAVEKQDEARAIGMIRDALSHGSSWSDLEPWLVRATLSHFLGFGHNMIYLLKVSQLLNRLGEEMTLSLVLPLVRRLVAATREDLIPEFKAYASQAEKGPLNWGQGNASQLSDPFGLSVKAALAWANASAAVAAPPEIHRVLMNALARNMLYFDTDYDLAFHRAVQHNVGWLDVTHGLTFGNAVRRICEKYPEQWYVGLLQMACFLGRNSPYLDLGLGVSSFAVSDRPAFVAQTLAQVTDHGQSNPLFSCHMLKTRQAVLEEADLAGGETADLLYSALNRFLSGSMKQRHVRRTVRQALALVAR